MRLLGVVFCLLAVVLGSHMDEPRRYNATPLVDNFDEESTARWVGFDAENVTRPDPWIMSYKWHEPVDVCIAFHTLAWNAWISYDTVHAISKESNEVIPKASELQKGPAVTIMRMMQLWFPILYNMHFGIGGLDPDRPGWVPDRPGWHVMVRGYSVVWEPDEQVRVALCYMDYSHQVAVMLEALRDQGTEFTGPESTRELMVDKIQHWGYLYAQIAVMLYKAIPDNEVYEVPRALRMLCSNPDEVCIYPPLMNESFPEVMPEWFKTRYGRPTGLTRIAAWLFKNDAPLSPQKNLFGQCLAEWKKRK